MTHDPWSNVNLGFTPDAAPVAAPAPTPPTMHVDPEQKIEVTAGAWMTLCQSVRALQDQNKEHAEALAKVTSILQAMSERLTGNAVSVK